LANWTPDCPLPKKKRVNVKSKKTTYWHPCWARSNSGL
jgi:hypothetical protein